MGPATTVLITVLSGILTYVAGQLVLKLWIEPVQELKKTIGKVSFGLIRHGQAAQSVLFSNQAAKDEATIAFRMLASELFAHLHLVPFYKVTARNLKLPSQSDLQEAAKVLVALSNGVQSNSNNASQENRRCMERICESLDIAMPQ